LGAVAIGLAVYFVRPAEPKYHGRGLSAWLVEFDGWDGNTNAPVVSAMRAMGAEAIPALLKMSLQNDSSLNQRIALEFEKHPAAMKHRFTTAPERWLRAGMALRVMGDVARPALPPLLVAMTNQSAFVRMRAVSVLGWIGPSAEDCVPALIGRQDDQSVRCNLMHTLGFMNRRPDLCVPVLIKGLEDADPIVRQNAAHSLGQFGHQASAAIPALTRALADKATARRAADALKKIQADQAVPKQGS
jgi:hypothetical protein